MEQFKLRTREIFAIILLTAGTKFTDATPSLFLPKTMMAAWMVPLLSAGFIAIPLLVLIKVIKKYNVGLVEMMQKVSGKYLGTFLCLLIFLYSVISTALLIDEFVNILSSLLFPQSSKELFKILLGIVCFLMASGGPYVLGRIAWIALPYIQIAFVLLLILAFSLELDTSYLFPFFGKGIDAVIKESFFHHSMFVECLLIAAMIPFMQKGKDFSKVALLGLGIIAIEMAVFFLFYILIFDAYSLAFMSFPFQQLTRTVQLGRFISNFEGYFLAFWFLASLIRYAIYLFVSTLFFTQTFNLKAAKFHLLPVTILCILIGLFPENEVKAAFYRDQLMYISSIFFVVLPFLLWVLSLRKKASVGL